MAGDSKANNRAKDQARAAWMSKHPGQFPDSVMKTHKNVEPFRKFGDQRGRISERQWNWGFLGGALAYAAGLTKINPADCVRG